MKTLWVLVLSAGLIQGVVLAKAVQDPPAEEPGEQFADEPPPRVVGQPQTQEEYDAWMAIQAATSSEVRLDLSEGFLEQFPESGLTPYVHDVLAQEYFQRNQFDRFLEHAEASLSEVPENPTLLVRLSYYHAEQGQSDKAISRGRQGMDAVAKLQRPFQVPEGQWRLQMDQLGAEVNYSVGLAYLNKVLEQPPDQRGDDPDLKEAIRYLEQSTEKDPSFDAAYFRLGFAHALLNDPDKAVENHARAVALEGIAADPARQQLQQVHEFVREHMPDSRLARRSISELISEQQEYLEQKIQEHQARYQ